MITFVIVLVVLIAMIVASMSNRDDLNRYQQLKNKRRFGGKPLSPSELEEIERLSRKYWWW